MFQALIPRKYLAKTLKRVRTATEESAPSSGATVIEDGTVSNENPQKTK